MTLKKLSENYSPCLFCPSKPILSSGICVLCYFYRIKRKLKLELNIIKL